MEEMNHRIKNCKLIIIKNVGHLPHEEASKIFNEKALAFLLGTKSN